MWFVSCVAWLALLLPSHDDRGRALHNKCGVNTHGFVIFIMSSALENSATSRIHLPQEGTCRTECCNCKGGRLQHLMGQSYLPGTHCQEMPDRAPATRHGSTSPALDYKATFAVLAITCCEEAQSIDEDDKLVVVSGQPMHCAS